jgi:uncharacterized protein (DUF58 family)
VSNPGSVARRGAGNARDVTSTALRWVANPGLLFGVICGSGLAGAGLLFSRPELVLFSAPILLAVVWALARRPGTPPRVEVGTVVGSRSSTDSVSYEVSFQLPDESDGIAVRLYARGRERWDVVVDPATAAQLRGEIGIVHSGPQEVVRVDYALLAPEGGYLTVPQAGPRSTRVISPKAVPLRRLPLPFRMLGLAGGHASARPGDGGEFRDISQFTPGDRLRRIDWKVTARRAQAPGDLYVRRSFSTADATALIMLDARDDVAELVTRWDSSAMTRDEPTSLDIARDAASSIATAYIKSGDRVGFQDLSSLGRIIAPGGGSRQLHRVLPAIARTAPKGAPVRRLRAPIIPAGAIVYVISTFLDDESARMAELWRVAGHRIVAVDTLVPTPIAKLAPAQRAAVRIISMERQDRLSALSALGIDVIHWLSLDGLTPESQLSARARSSRGPR